MKKVTIQDIADELGISRNTVSKAINNAEGLADATRERIFQKAIEMGYKQFSYIRDHSNAGMDQGRRTKCEIALLAGSIIDSSHFASLMLDKLKKELSQSGYKLIAHRVDKDSLFCRTLPFSFDPKQVCAIICIEIFNRGYAEMICELGLPVLFVDGPNKRDGNDLPADQLYMDNTTAINRFINDMLEQGKRKIGFIGDYEHCQSFYERYIAFRSAMLMADVPVDERFCIKTNDSERLTEVLTTLTETPDVFICANDFIADNAIYIMRRKGKSIPEDVFFCGFDDAPISRIMTPSLTTVHIHTQIMAVTAIQLLITRIEQPDLDFRTVYTETELVYRDSTRL